MSQERTYLRYYGLLGQRFSFIKMDYQMEFEVAFQKQYSLIHRLETNKLRNTAKFFAHLMATDALPWTVRRLSALLYSQSGLVGDKVIRTYLQPSLRYHLPPDSGTGHQTGSGARRRLCVSEFRFGGSSVGQNETGRCTFCGVVRCIRPQSQRATLPVESVAIRNPSSRTLRNERRI
jgi:hypothetical protein